MFDPYSVITRPLVTEQSMSDMGEKKYVFVVKKDANKTEIKNAVEKIFSVKVRKVNTMNMQGKTKRMGRHVGKRPSWKKAIVMLTEDSNEIEFFEGV
ncbi:large subunit ribosomal protein L23 [Tindallia magadiensis]|uniref:Large ribosomal subunit protein uL23 n=1 Tax=Tindallia magadiensis TaxID=69895 RepID=A0A1I3HFH9_9FIRM|nr:50S ribosomal protein L23 [Tindallia magadiensis]SFI34495.1 large subunit ribosomal protein L23 [Tindallia magadiensis]